MQSKLEMFRPAGVPVAIMGISSVILIVSIWLNLKEFARLEQIPGATASAILLNVALILFAWSQYKDALRARRAALKARAKARLLQGRDPHTGLFNRASFFEQGEKMIEGLKRPGQGLGLLLIDLKRFGGINDAHGHEFGDELLRQISGALAEAVPDGAICARLGGDEFAVALPLEEGEAVGLAKSAMAIAEQLERPFEIDGVAASVLPAIGVAALKAGGATISTLLWRADLALNIGKKDKKRVTWFQPNMDKIARARCDIEAGLRAGITRGEFVPHYQPQIEFATGRIVGFEMLARWNHPSGRLLGPDLFIPVAEESGLIAPLSETLIRQALDEARDWDSSVTLSVNISPVQLCDSSLAEKIARLLDESGFPAQRLDLEITESSLIENLELAKAVIGEIKGLGVTLTMDDFGTGYSSLAHLRALPFDRIKIDRSFAFSLNKDPESSVIVRAIVNLAHNLGLPVTAEGVESAATDLRLRGLGCDRGQGWLFGKAAPAATARALLRQQEAVNLWAQESPVRAGSSAVGSGSMAARGVSRWDDPEIVAPRRSGLPCATLPMSPRA